MPANSRPVRRVRLVLGLMALLVLFVYGVGVGAYHWPPFLLLKIIKDSTVDEVRSARAGYRGDDELLRFGFTDPLILGEQIYPPLTSLDDVYKANEALMIPVEEFFDAYANLKIMGASYRKLNESDNTVLEVSFKLASRTYSAYAYSPKKQARHDRAALIIPGSGLNQSLAIHNNKSSNYQFGINDSLGNTFEKYTLIKPNEDSLAFHDNKQKLSYIFITNWLLNRTGSYSVTYIVDSLAITKYLNSEYDEVVVAGLSQGGEAALLNALQSEPDAAIIASGFSIIKNQVNRSGHEQIIIPGLYANLSFATIRSRIQKSPTNFLFTYGAKEVGTYKIEAEERRTCEYLSDSRNVSCVIHAGGHLFPKEVIIGFLRSNFEPAS